MGNLRNAVFDTGPFIHLHEINQLGVSDVVEEKYISSEVRQELGHWAVPLGMIKNLAVKSLALENKDMAKAICGRYGLEVGEATSIALARQEKIRLFFTDDLEAREVARTFALDAHGTLGLVTRSLREKRITKENAIDVVKALAQQSSLFLTSDLVDWAINEIQQFKNR